MPQFAYFNDQFLAGLLRQGRMTLSSFDPTGIFRMNGPGGCNGEAICQVSGGKISHAGEFTHRFTLMSAIKPFLLLRLLECHGAREVARWVDDMASAMPYYSLEQLQADHGKPRNAMINSGAMLLASRLPGTGPLQQQGLFLEWLRTFAPQARLALDGECLADVMEAGGDPSNRALAEELEMRGRVTEAAAAYEIYFRLCCLAGSIRDVAWLGHALATTASAHRTQVLETMAGCGLYEASPAWYAATRLPAKSGVSGVMFGIWPGEGCLAVCSPWLDTGGNPILPQLVLAAAASGGPADPIV